MDIMKDWRLDRYYTTKAVLLDLSMQIEKRSAKPQLLRPRRPAALTTSPKPAAWGFFSSCTALTRVWRSARTTRLADPCVTAATRPATIAELSQAFGARLLKYSHPIAARDGRGPHQRWIGAPVKPCIGVIREKEPDRSGRAGRFHRRHGAIHRHPATVAPTWAWAPKKSSVNSTTKMINGGADHLALGPAWHRRPGWRPEGPFQVRAAPGPEHR